ncbi:hypothetical protein ERO13_D07G155800v2 [Gossypium hirsutum]|uniref:Uncharacterized protein n=4 Tax=Gossypium TaxID=3633 RepID=A0A5D2U912_GOSMU|nr:hypothetical protein ERO13_D07G155800v2 [Gossypium hirsutum]TYH63244.1 hypothetical protein ES332_D07G177700v1 [Gossypium tomentosum]TYI74041.1 hypothetical protein E1A91_D07G172500v1 [Gossypium mustelinum]KAG4138803.1 hypothetical protein ERO13_D07G155800v2 [Gossypium hirsutum]TYH63245.1 hypothetical protein ES332_D07G177700v1 [Gossypium tomentosum]
MPFPGKELFLKMQEMLVPLEKKHLWFPPFDRRFHLHDLIESGMVAQVSKDYIPLAVRIG